MKLTILLLLFSCSAFAQQYSSNTAADIQEINKIYFSGDEKLNEALRLRYPINTINGETYVSFLGKVNPSFSASEFEQRGINVGSQVGDIVSIRYPINQLENILSESDLTYIKMAGKVQPLLDRVQIGTRVDSVWAGINLPQGYTGKDVIIGVTDWGFDYSSPMFYDTLLSESRILAAWDQFKISGNAPNGYTYGAEYASPGELQTAASDTANVYSYATHGTHVAGIAGGSGAGLNYRGMAFESEFLFVTFRFDESFVLDAWNWMQERSIAEGKRLVINMSWGIYHFGALDGTDLLQQALDTMTGEEVLFVTSAGNNGNVDFHIAHEFASDSIKTRVAFYNSSMPNLFGQSIQMWGEAGSDFEIQLLGTNGSTILNESPWYSTATTTTYIDSFIVASGTDTIFYNFSADAAYPSNGRPQARLRIKYPSNPNGVGIRIRATDGTVHLWNVTELTDDVGNWGMQLATFGAGWTPGDKNYGIGIPACANTALSVGAYASEYYTQSGTLVGGAAANFSSLGPIIDGSEKPDVSAPGVSVASSISSYTDASFSTIESVDFNGRTYPFARFNGTSMSSPAAAGIAALILDANPYLSAAQVKNIIITTARTDNFTGTIPPHSTKWGWGKINAYAAIQLALNTTGMHTAEKSVEWQVYPNPTTDQIVISGIQDQPEILEVIDLRGKSLIHQISGLSIDVSAIPAGVYLLKMVRNGKVEQQRFVKQ